jgi:hypothetical protein
MISYTITNPVAFACSKGAGLQPLTPTDPTTKTPQAAWEPVTLCSTRCLAVHPSPAPCHFNPHCRDSPSLIRIWSNQSCPFITLTFNIVRRHGHIVLGAFFIMCPRPDTDIDSFIGRCAMAGRTFGTVVDDSLDTNVSRYNAEYEMEDAEHVSMNGSQCEDHFTWQSVLRMQHTSRAQPDDRLLPR